MASDGALYILDKEGRNSTYKPVALETQGQEGLLLWGCADNRCDLDASRICKLEVRLFYWSGKI